MSEGRREWTEADLIDAIMEAQADLQSVLGRVRLRLRAGGLSREEIEALLVGSEGVVDTAFVVEFERSWVEALQSVLAEADPLTRLTASLYNRPIVTGHLRITGWNRTRFLRWHELDEGQKDATRAALADRLDELELRAYLGGPDG